MYIIKKHVKKEFFKLEKDMNNKSSRERFNICSENMDSWNEKDFDELEDLIYPSLCEPDIPLEQLDL